MKPVPTLPNGTYPFREEFLPLAELAMAEAPPELARFLVEQASQNGVELLRDQVVELVCHGEGMAINRFTIYWPSEGDIHLLVPRRHVVGRA